MADKHPYISGGGPLLKTIQHLRNSLPPTIDATVLKKLGLAPKNESYLIETSAKRRSIKDCCGARHF